MVIGKNQLINTLSRVTVLFGLPVGFSILIIGMLSIFAPVQAIDSSLAMIDALLRISPFILLSVTIAAYLKASGVDQIVASAFRGSPAKAIVVASIFGALSPFCSCGVIPLVAGLLVAGVPIAPVLAFCIASPIMDPEMFILTAAELGIEFALIKTVSAIVMGLLAGYGTLLISKTGYLDDSLKDIAQPNCSSSCSNEDKAEVVYKFWKISERRSTFGKEVFSVGLFLTRWLAFAFLLESLMLVYVPNDLIVNWLGDGNAFALPLAVILGVPAYLNGYASIPLVGGLIEMGMSPATALAFMLAGSVTSIPAAIAIYSLAKPRLFSLYLIFAGLGATGAGYMYLFWLSV
ncbi:MAG: permease [Gammaproteobacteria bacterium]